MPAQARHWTSRNDIDWEDYNEGKSDAESNSIVLLLYSL